jgi:hypothetical protein
MDVRQLFGAAQRVLLDLFDLSGVGIEAALVRWRQEMRRQAGRIQGHHIFALGGGRPLFSLMPLSRIEGIVAIRPNLQARIVEADGTLIVRGA